MSDPPVLSGAVMAHPRRAAEARSLAAVAPAGLLRVVLDPDPEGPPTALRTAALAWSSVPQGSTHHLVLQDDVLLADGFFEHASAAAEALPDSAVAFYANWNSRNGGAVRMAALAGADWVDAVPEYAPCVALMLPAAVAAGYRDYAEHEGAGWPYDVLMHRYLRSTGTPLRIAVPNVVEHSAIPSLAGNAAHGLRRSALFTGTAVPARTPVLAAFPVVPFFKHGLAQCAVRHGEQWEHLETERYLRRSGVDLAACRRDFETAAPKGVRPETAWQVWLTAFAMGRAAAPVGSLEAALATIGPGGLCDELDPAQLAALADPLGELATAALAAGRRCADRPAATAPIGAPATALVGDGPFTDQLGRLLADLGHEVRRLRGPVAAADLAGAGSVVQLGTGHLTDLLNAAAEAGVDRLVYACHGAPSEQERLRLAEAREAGVPVQVLCFADPVGPYAPTATVVARWIERAWTRRPLRLSPGRRHHLVDSRDLASAIDTVLGSPALSPALVLGVVSATVTETELADLVCAAARSTSRELDGTGAQAPYEPPPAAAFALAGLGRQPAASVAEGLRAFAQWLAYDTECPR